MDLSQLDLPTSIADVTMLRLAGDDRTVQKIISEFVVAASHERQDLLSLPSITRRYLMIWLTYNMWAVETIRYDPTKHYTMYIEVNNNHIFASGIGYGRSAWSTSFSIQTALEQSATDLYNMYKLSKCHG
jgi:hypothetical protein